MTQPKSSNKTIVKLLGLVALMFAFTFALVPLYDVLCDVTGLNGKTGGQVQLAATEIDESRTINIEFIAINNAEIPWEFKPAVSKIKLHPGEVFTTAYFAKNNSDTEMTVQAIPSVSPGAAAKYLKKMECFCFKQQTMQAHNGRDMPLQFVLDKDLPQDIKTLTLSYTLFEIKAKS